MDSNIEIALDEAVAKIDRGRQQGHEYWEASVEEARTRFRKLLNIEDAGKMSESLADLIVEIQEFERTKR